jgi:hypothetical protein
MQQELREAFRLYDKEGKHFDDNFYHHIWNRSAQVNAVIFYEDWNVSTV